MNALTIVKIGGNVIDQPERLQAFVQSFADLPGPKLLVHGGGSIATRMGDRLGIPSRYVDGRRITDAETLELITMVYAGLVNKQLVAGLQNIGCNALGLTGADGALIQATKRPVQSIDYGFVGDIQTDGVNLILLRQLLEAGIVPVIAPLSYEQGGSLLNTNADTIAQELAKALSSYYDTSLIYCFEKAGVLQEATDPNSVIPTIDTGSFQELQATGIVGGGMIPKLSNALAAKGAGVQHIIIGQAEDLPQLLTQKKGTRIL